jgi:PAS domain S-box-containing protein
VNASAASPNADFTLLQSFIEALPDPCVVIDRSCNVIAVNSAWNQLTHQKEASGPAGHPVGANYLALCRSTSTEKGLEEVRMGIEAVLSGDSQQFEREYIYPSSDTFRWCRKIVRPFRQFGAHALIFHREITAEKMVPTHPHVLDEEFRALADSAPVLIWTSGPDKGCTFFNRQWLEFTGIPLEDQLGDGWLQVVHTEDRDGILRAYNTAFDQARDFEFEYRVRHRDGGYRWIRDRGLPRFDSQNRLAGFVGSAWDLSDQKQATEAAYKATRQTRLEHIVALVANSATTVREALQHAIDAICETMAFPVGHALVIYDDEPELAKPAHILRCKDMQRFAALFEVSQKTAFDPSLGLPGQVMRTGKPVIHDMSPEYSDPKLYPRSAAALQAGLRAAIHFPVLVENKVEAILEFGSDYPVASDHELTETLLAVCERLSRFFERRRAQIIFLNQKEELETAAQQLFTAAGRAVDSQEEERRRIARELHDDFSQRLALVSMKITNLAGRDRVLSAGELNADLEDVRESISSVAEDLHGLSRQLHPARLELLGLVRALRAQCNDFQRTRGIEIIFEASASDEDTAPQGAMCLYRVLQESLMNITKHSESTRARVNLDRRGDQLEMRIRDHGKGFSPNDTRPKGIGLVNMEERVRLLKGSLIINSNPGEGTEILVRLPVAPQGQQQHPQP